MGYSYDNQGVFTFCLTSSFELILGVTTASPPKNITLDDMMSSGKDLSNLTLAHEIIVNRDFHLEPPKLAQNRYTWRLKCCLFDPQVFLAELMGP